MHCSHTHPPICTHTHTHSDACPPRRKQKKKGGKLTASSLGALAAAEKQGRGVTRGKSEAGMSSHPSSGRYGKLEGDMQSHAPGDASTGTGKSANRIIADVRQNHVFTPEFRTITNAHWTERGLVPGDDDTSDEEGGCVCIACMCTPTLTLTTHTTPHHTTLVSYIHQTLPTNYRVNAS